MSDYETTTEPPAYIAKKWHRRHTQYSEIVTFIWMGPTKNPQGVSLRVTYDPDQGATIQGPSSNLYSPRPVKPSNDLTSVLLDLTELLIYLHDPHAHERGVTVGTVAETLGMGIPAEWKK